LLNIIEAYGFRYTFFKAANSERKKFEDFGILCEKTEFEVDFFKCYVIRQDCHESRSFVCGNYPLGGFVSRLFTDILARKKLT
jgi:hypothetical protein